MPGRRVGVPCAAAWAANQRGDRRGGAIVRCGRIPPGCVSVAPYRNPGPPGAGGVTLATARHRRGRGHHDGAPADLVPAADGHGRPPLSFVADIQGRQTRSGTVNIDLALTGSRVRQPPGSDPEIHGGTIVLAESLDDVETAFQQAVAASRRRCCSPTSAFPASSTTRSRRPAGTSCRCSPSGCPRATWTRRGRANWTRTRTGCRAGRGGRAGLHQLGAGPPGDRAHQMQEEYGLVGGSTSTASCRWGRCSTPAPPRGTRTCARRSGGCTRPVRHRRRRRGHRHSGRNVVRQALAYRRAQRWTERRDRWRRALARRPARRFGGVGWAAVGRGQATVR